MWKEVESAELPVMIDKISSGKWVYVRKLVTESEIDGKKIYKYKEKKIPKNDWAIYEEVLSNTNGIAELEDALCELSELLN